MADIWGESVIGKGTYLGEHVIVGHPGKDEKELMINRDKARVAGATIGKDCVIRDHTIIYSNAILADAVQTGNRALVREYSTVGDHSLVGTGVVIEDKCAVGARVSLQSGVYIPTNTTIEDDVFIGPNASLTNDKYMGRGEIELVGAHIHAFARIGSNATILPGIVIGKDALVAAGAVVTRDVDPFSIVMGVPARKVGEVPPAHRKADRTQ